MEINLIEDEDDAGGFWSICLDNTLVEKSSGNKLLCVVWMSTYIKKMGNEYLKYNIDSTFSLWNCH